MGPRPAAEAVRQEDRGLVAAVVAEPETKAPGRPLLHRYGQRSLLRRPAWQRLEPVAHGFEQPGGVESLDRPVDLARGGPGPRAQSQDPGQELRRRATGGLEPDPRDEHRLRTRPP